MLTGVLERYRRSITDGAQYDIPDGRFLMVRGADLTGTREIVLVQNFFKELKLVVPSKYGSPVPCRPSSVRITREKSPSV